MNSECAVLVPGTVEISRGMAFCPHPVIREVFEIPLREALVTGRDLRVDLSKVDTVQTAMLSHLVYASRRLNKRNCKVILVGPSEAMVDMVKMCRLDKLIQVEAKPIAEEFEGQF